MSWTKGGIKERHQRIPWLHIQTVGEVLVSLLIRYALTAQNSELSKYIPVEQLALDLPGLLIRFKRILEIEQGIRFERCTCIDSRASVH